jgi:HSP20 family protein
MNQPQSRGWDPFGELQSLRSELSRLIGGGHAGFGQPVDMRQTDDGWEISVGLPGVAPDEVAVDVDDRELRIRARTEAEVNAEAGAGATGTQRRAFDYRVALPSNVDADRIDATMDHGLLTVHLPRSSRPPRRTITVGRSGSLPPTATHVDPAAERELHHRLEE